MNAVDGGPPANAPFPVLRAAAPAGGVMPYKLFALVTTLEDDDGTTSYPTHWISRAQIERATDPGGGSWGDLRRCGNPDRLL